jgi:hypothetical protein
MKKLPPVPVAVLNPVVEMAVGDTQNACQTNQPGFSGRF